ncbi:translation elongation factor 2 (EF-2/EF-G) [Deinococcus geothermalis DSM 11300]|uniref:Translation elongation factor 2 (EF-2/EF-G) n=1 Tax=Deinococcus geothermalis (strain DSM 11300 / CIP 105573 / AG-3a) TaxID=319795 RepID=Q1IYD6_DEIGD|nr:elongation factor G [Deinococcus geothermalis]ABF45748.1 translation elongation factor 2 (EF-2/EF-G) [Deinococcus geothermalis DSM 11300]
MPSESVVPENTPVRVVSLAGHSGAGKTTLAEALLVASGALLRAGRVTEGTTQSDHTDAEKQHGFSITTGVLRLSQGGTDITLLDTPGYADFVREIRGGIRAADSVLMVVSAVSGVEVGTERVWATADRFEMPRLVVISKMDRERANFHAVLADLRASLRGPVAAAYLPVGEGPAFRGVVDVLTAAPDELPGELRPALNEAREALVDAIVETDDDLMNRYLEGEAIGTEELRAALLRAVHAGRLYPVVPVSAETGVGVPELLNLMVVGLRSASERGVLTGVDGQTREPTPNAPASARVWRVSVDPFVGKLAYIRVWSGTIRPGDTLRNTTRGVDVKPAHLYVVSGKDLTEVSELRAGMIGVLTKIPELHTGDTLADPAHPIEYDPLVLPDPAHTVALFPKTRQDEDRLSSAIGRLLDEDPTLRFAREGQTGELLLSGMGDMHTTIAVEKLAALGVNVDTGVPQIPYRETIRAVSQAQGKHKKQSGGHGQYGDCHLRVEPREGFSFCSEVVGGAIPGKYLPSIEKGVQDAMQKGPLAGYPMQDVHVAVTHGSYHDVDSSDLAFRTAGALAFRNAVEGAKPVLLEPVMLLKVRAPAQFTGDLIGDLQTRRARVQGMDPAGTVITITAVVPQSELQTYSADLRSMTGDRGAFSVKPAGYQDLPEHLAKKVIEARKAASLSS